MKSEKAKAHEENPGPPSVPPGNPASDSAGSPSVPVSGGAGRSDGSGRPPRGRENGGPKDLGAAPPEKGAEPPKEAPILDLDAVAAAVTPPAAKPKRKRKKKTEVSWDAIPFGTLWKAIADPLFRRWEVAELSKEESEALDEATRACAKAYLPALEAHAPAVALVATVIGVFLPRVIEAARKKKEEKKPEVET